MSRVAVLDHGMGNLRSVAKALEAAGADVIVTADPGEIRAARGLCVPGQGIFGRCMANLARLGMGEVIRSWIEQERPYLGICLGMQILFEKSEEGARAGLGVLGGVVTRLPATVRVPHIGWNLVTSPSGEAEHYYFDHSFAAHPADPAVVRGWCEHGDTFAARVQAGSATAVQFHPEKSSAAGIKLLRGWVESL